MKTITSVLSGDIWNDGGVWRTKDVDDKTGGMFLHGFRTPAASMLAREPGTMLFIHGGLAEGARPSLASVMHRELRELSIPEELLLMEETTATTYQQLLALQEAVHMYESAEVAVLSNEWHLPRVAAMLKHASGLAVLRARNPKLVAAEDVLLGADAAHWHRQIEAARQSPEMHTRKILEQKGVDDLKEGRYHFR